MGQWISVLHPLIGQPLGEEEHRVAVLLELDTTHKNDINLVKLGQSKEVLQRTYREQISGWNDEMIMFRSPA